MQEDWDDLRLLLALSRAGSLSRAAAALRLDPTTIARHLAKAEARAGLPLFDRPPGRLEPTETGARLIRLAAQIEAEIQGAEVALAERSGKATGKVRLTAVPLLANRLLVPALPRLRERHTDMEVELIAEPRDLRLMERETDIALRLARPRGELDCRAARIGMLTYAVYVRADADAEALPWIGYGASMATLPQAIWLAEQSSEPPALRVNDAETLLHAVLAGIGKSLLPIAVAGSLRDLRRLDHGPAPSREIWMITHPKLSDLPSVRATTDWLRDIIAKLPG